MGRTHGKGTGKGLQIEAMAFFECYLADPMLLGVMTGTQAHGPPIGRLDPCPTVSAAPNMRALDILSQASGDRAGMAPHPGTMAWETAPNVLTATIAMPALGQHHHHATSRRGSLKLARRSPIASPREM